MNEILERLEAPMPKFFKTLQKIAIGLGAISTIIATAPLSLPIAIVTTGSYLAWVSASIVVVTQLTAKNKIEDDTQLELK